MNFDLEKSLEILSRTPDVLDSLLKDLSPFWTDESEGRGKWSAKEAVAHLVHGEIEDWIPRIKIILFEKDKRFKPFDPSGMDTIVKGKNVNDLLELFRSLRKKNLEELSNFKLKAEDFQKTAIHPEFGEVTLQQHLSTWTVHDLNHLYQISRVVGKRYSEDIGPWKKYIRLIRD